MWARYSCSVWIVLFPEVVLPEAGVVFGADGFGGVGFDGAPTV